jgi:DNA-binding NarL/FixJ family response regulator
MDDFQIVGSEGGGHDLPADVVRVNLDLTALIEDLLNLMRSSISKKALLDLDLQTGLPPLRGDASQLGQVVVNLVINASEAIGEGSGVISVSTGAVDCSREYLAETYTGRIFEPFFTTKFTGRGLDGQETFQELVRLDPDVRVVMSSGFTEQEITSRFAGQGLVGFVPKPYSLDVLRERLQAAL